MNGPRSLVEAERLADLARGVATEENAAIVEAIVSLTHAVLAQVALTVEVLWPMPAEAGDEWRRAVGRLPAGGPG